MVLKPETTGVREVREEELENLDKTLKQTEHLLGMCLLPMFGNS